MDALTSRPLVAKVWDKSAFVELRGGKDDMLAVASAGTVTLSEGITNT